VVQETGALGPPTYGFAASSWVRAHEVLDTSDPAVVEVDLLSETDEQGGRACGGIMYVHIERLG
jgi:hypothetical protein